MGFFTKDAEPGLGSRLTPLSPDRIKRTLEQESWSYSVDTDGDVSGTWEYGSFYFFVNGNNGELLCVRGFWLGTLDDSDYLRALEVCNEWNAEKLWPKTYVGRDDEGKVRLNTELNVDYEHGLTDDQLLQHLAGAVDTSMTFFEHLNETFPEAWEKHRLHE